MTPDDLTAHWLTSQQAAAELQITQSRLFQLRLAQRIPVTRLGKSTHLYNRADIEAFKESRHAAPNNPT